MLCYYLTDKVPQEITFTGMRTDELVGKHQFSRPTISLDGRMLSFFDINWLGGPINVTLDFVHSFRFAHDPQVGNVPRPT